MIVKVNEVEYHPEQNGYITENEYDLELPDEKILDKITIKNPVYWYALIDGKLFKSDQQKGLNKILFASKESLAQHLAQALYWRKGLVPRIGQGVGYDTNDFYKKLINTYKIEFKQIQF